MKYIGSKNKISKYILPFINKYRKPDAVYVEPFCGGCNMIDKVPQGTGRIANDIHPYLGYIFKALVNNDYSMYPQNNMLTVTEYKHIRDNKELYNPALVGFVGFNCGFGGGWFNGYVHSNKTINYALRGRNNLEKQKPNLMGIEFYNKHYYDLPIPTNTLIYCDPPYISTKSYKGTQYFSHDLFYKWVRVKISLGHTVLISSYEAPPDFKCVFEKEIQCSINRTKTSSNKIKTRMERLYIHESQVC